jgi:hypothetical protein
MFLRFDDAGIVLAQAEAVLRWVRLQSFQPPTAERELPKRRK